MTIASLFEALPLAVLATLPAAPAAPGDSAPADNVLRVYDLSGTDVSTDQDHDPFQGVLLPALPLDWPEGSMSTFAEGDQAGGADAMVDLLDRLFGDELAYEGRSVRLGPDGRLAIRAPAELHTRIAELVAFFDGTLNAEVELLVDVLRVDPGSGPSASVLDVAQAESWIEQARAAGRHEAYRLHVRGDRPYVLDRTTNVAAVVDYDVEIAQASGIPDPIMARVPVGPRIALRAVPGRGGLFLALGWENGDLLDELARSLGNKLLVTGTDQPISIIEAGGVVQGMRLLRRAAALNTFVPEGRALLVRTRAALSRASLDEVLVLRAGAGGLMGRGSLVYDSRGAELAVMNLGSLAPPRCVAWGSLLWPGHVPSELRAWLGHGDDALLGYQLREGGDDFAEELLLDDKRSLGTDRVGRWLFVHPESGGTPAATVLAEQQRLSGQFEDLVPEARLLDLGVALRHVGDGPAREAVAVRAPVRAGESSSFVVGLGELEVRDYDVEVAQLSAIADPGVVHAFDGLALWVLPAYAPDGGLYVDVRGGGQLYLAHTQFELGNPMMPWVDQTTSTHVLVNERVRMDRGEDGRWRATFGLTGGNGVENGLQLAVEIGEIGE